MDKQEIVKNYNVKDGRIVSPGKFEGEPIFAPYFYAAWNDGQAEIVDELDGEDMDGSYAGFTVTDFDVRQFPELAPHQGNLVLLHEDGNGFVRLRIRKGK